MKLSRKLILTTALSAFLGLGAAVGAHQAKQAMEVKAAGTKVLYLDPNIWNQGAGERYYGWLFGGTSNDKWYEFTADNSHYSAEVSDDYTKVIFLRSGPSMSPGWTKDTNYWNRTGDLVFGSNNCFTVTAWGDSQSTGTWSTYTPPATEYSVEVYVDGVKRGTETIGEGELPTEPNAQFGKQFSGWFSDSACTAGNEVTGVTSNAPIYCKMNPLPTVTYTIDDSRVSYGALKLYAFEGSVTNAGWPGVAISNKTITIPNDAEFIINDGTNQTVDITQSGIANDTLRILSSKTGGKNDVVWESQVDEPASDGYYIVGTYTNDKYAGAIKMSADPSGNNNAIYVDGFSGTANQHIKVRMYEANRQAGPDVWSNFIANEYSAGLGVADENGNFKFSKDCTIDIFAKWSGSDLQFFVSEHAERYDISIYDVFFAGKDLESTSAQAHVEMATEGQTFNYTLPSVTGYVARQLYTDASCTTAYVPHAFDADGILYAKYTKLGYYLAGGVDTTFSVDTATLITGDGNNKLVGTVVVPNTASAQNPYNVKPLEYVADAGQGEPGWNAEYYELGHEETPAFVHIDDHGNFAFTVPGTYAFYVNAQDEVWFNGGEYAFHARFLTEVGGICNSQGGTNLTTLKAKWSEMETAYKGLSEQEIANIEAVTFDGGNEHSSDDRLKMVAMYHYIVWKYGTAEFKDFIFGQTDIPPHKAYNNSVLSNFIETSTTPIIAVAIASMTALSLTLFFVLKKKKQD